MVMVTVALLTRLRLLSAPQRTLGFGFLRLLQATHTARSSLTARCLSVGLLGRNNNNNYDKGNKRDAFMLALQQQQQLVIKCRNYARLSTKSSAHCANKTDAKSSSTAAADLFGESANMGLFAKFKHMYKQYWYVLIPVHVLTSVGWFGGFYYLSKSGVDVPALLQYVHLSETIIEKVQGSDMGHYAIAYLCYKVATPLRYALTLGGTTVSIKYLVQAGHIKPIPSKSQLLKMYEDKKATRASAKADKAEKDESSQSNHK
ncbi:uncharacterized protein C18orf19 homolog A [Scaptodrosophila lebanonensis]|uniref:Uncharacterized protein C18orf19 homolog A n=1 Tax=Drosophila lebanonensis TaxID=7225 RepID=A0A6J2TN58_DROLE|nr:uncharacterized protein C18orf19 homolog A [Scaptodrosophila lebanonensis]